MTNLLSRRSRAELPVMLNALDEALRALDGRSDPDVIERGRAIVRRAGERLRLSGHHTVVALAGATGSGKSSLFNALAGTTLSPTGVRRPTTSRPHACVWGEEGAEELIKWLDVPLTQVTYFAQTPDASESGDTLDGLVLLDLPDHDSTAVSHRLEVDRLVELVDLLVWVVDPQKYADALLHERYLRELARHDAVTVIVLNQIDTLTPAAAQSCAADLRRLVDEDGLRGARIVSCSATTGTGLDDLRALLAHAVRRRRARSDRLIADVESVVSQLGDDVADGAATTVGRGETAGLIEALSSSAGVPVIGAAVQRSWELRAVGYVGWPPTRWLRRLRPDPLRRLHLRPEDRRDVGSMLRSSVPEPSSVQRAQVETAVRRVCDSAGRGLPRPWQAAVRAAAGEASEDVRDQLDAAVVGTDLGVDRTPHWWRIAATLQWLLVAAGLVGLGWLGVLAFGSYLQLPELPTPEVRGFAVPTLLAVGGVAAGILLATIARFVARAGARARRRRAENRLRDAIAQVVERLVVRPVEAELARHAAARDALSRVRRR